MTLQVKKKQFLYWANTLMESNLTRNPKIKGSNPAPSTRRENKTKMFSF